MALISCLPFQSEPVDNNWNIHKAEPMNIRWHYNSIVLRSTLCIAHTECTVGTYRRLQNHSVKGKLS